MNRIIASDARRAPRLAVAGLTLGLMLLAPGAFGTSAPATPPTYKMQPILKIGDTVNGIAIKLDHQFFLGPLNDRGQLPILVGDYSGAVPGTLLQYSGGQFTTIAGPGLDSPAGKFPADVSFSFVFGMNQLGNIVFAACRKGGANHLGTFLWDNQAKKLTAVELPGMPAVNDLTFLRGEGYYHSTINNAGEIAFAARVRPVHAGLGLFFLGRDDKLQPVALPDQQLSGAGYLGSSALPYEPQINDAGAVAFLALETSELGLGAYVWEQGAITPLAVVGGDAPGGGTIREVEGAWLNNANGSVLLAISLQGIYGPFGLYRFAGGTLTPLVVPGQEMPGGGKFGDLLWGSWGPGTGAGPANDAGQHVFIAVLADNTQGVYLLGTDGKLSLILKSGTSTDLGTITRFGRSNDAITSVGVSLNNKGQVALPISFDNGPDTIVLLMPTPP